MPDGVEKSARVAIRAGSVWSGFARLLERVREWPVK